MQAKRRLGQNFLVDSNLQRKIVDALEPHPADTIVEIGPGLGALTRHLARTRARIVAIELDSDLAADLAARFAGPDPRHGVDPGADHGADPGADLGADRGAGVTVVHEDFLDWDPGDLGEVASLKVVGNIPYNITSPILFRLLEWPVTPERIVVMVQREVAERLLARPGTKAYGALTVGIQAQAEVERLFHVGRQAFRPVPGVDSTVITIRPRQASGPGTGDALRALTRAAFGMRRKQLQKILRTAPGYGLDPERAEGILVELGLRPEDRPESLDPGTFVRLAAALERLGYP